MDVSCSEISGEINFVLFVETYGQRFLYLGSVLNTILKSYNRYLLEKYQNAPVAQLDRVPDYESGG